jgi:serine/threonine protein kinase
MMRFRVLLSEYERNPRQAVLDTIVKYGELSSRVAVVATSQQAVEIYQDAIRMPKSTTRAMLRDAGFILDGPLHGAVSSKATFLKAFQKGVPVAVKICDSPQNARDELSRIEDLRIPPASPFQVGLVPVTEWSPPRSLSPMKNLSLKAIKSVKEAPQDIGYGTKVFMVMPHYPSTLKEFPLPVPTEYAFCYGKDVLSGLEHCWDRGYGFCDCKPDNIFISSEGRAHLGDYGGLTKLGEPYRETTQRFLPSDFLSDTASVEMDLWMLTVSLLELLQNSRLTSPLKIAAVIQNVRAVEDETLKSFLLDLISRIH